MLAELTDNPAIIRPLAELLRPRPKPDAPETRVLACGVTWAEYEDFDAELDAIAGADRSGPRLYFLEDQLEIMSTSTEHERIKSLLGDLMAIYFRQPEMLDIEIFPRGEATLRQALRQAGAEPDESWCFGTEKPLPDLVVEIALTSGGVDKLEIYRRLRILEVWLWRRGSLEIYHLASAGESYIRETKSAVLPGLNLTLLSTCLALPGTWRAACAKFQNGLTAGKHPPRKDDETTFP